MTKRDWLRKSSMAVMLGASLLMFAEGGQAAIAPSEKAAEVVSLAKSQLGKDYTYGAEGPASFGSAGLATYIFGKVGITIDDTIAELYRTGKAVAKSDLKAGDLVFFSSSGAGAPTFMGIYIGDNKFIYSSMSEDKVVQKTFSDYSHKFLGARRFLTEGTTQQPAPAPRTIGDKVVAAGLKYLGTPYEYGSSRSTKTTMDCSEFVMWAYKEGAGIDLGRSGAQSHARYVKEHGTYTYDINKLQKGDIVFFMSYRGWRESDYNGINPRNYSITHEAIYMGDGKLLHTFSKESGGVKITNFKDTHWEWRFIMGGRPYK
ncbi:C40 family peptidase [Brevibacillus sp. H7]|uniref:C40 family peptidase n=1 Tax=Brevibacillus sp. H7 TaxID=3349138 RepID=UPI00381B4097